MDGQDLNLCIAGPPPGTREAGADVSALLGTLTGIFARLCQEVEAKYPDTDIPGFLQAIALMHSCE
jgi:hypothetical protein